MSIMLEYHVAIVISIENESGCQNRNFNPQKNPEILTHDSPLNILGFK